MTDVLLAFSVIWAVTGVGWLIGRFQLLGAGAETVLARLVFFVATPALLVVTLPAAQNVFVYALRYRQGVAIARNAVIVSTVAALPVLALATHFLS